MNIHNSRNTESIEEIDFDEIELTEEDLTGEDDDLEWINLRVDACTCGVKCKGIAFIEAYVPRGKYKKNEIINQAQFKIIDEKYLWRPSF